MNDAQRQFLTDVTRVQALYLLRVIRETGRKPEDLIVTQTPWHRQVPAIGSAWCDFVARAVEILCPAGVAPDSETERVERFVEFAIPLFVEGMKDDAAAERRLRWFGSFRFVEHPEQETISLHISNRCVPRSPFEDMGACFGWLRDLCAAAEALPFPVRKVSCGSWLNDRADFLRLFPVSYVANMKLSSPDGKTGGGWWGQMVDRRGRLHQARAAQLLKTGRFPHPRKESWCDFQAFKEHVSKGFQAHV